MATNDRLHSLSVPFVRPVVVDFILSGATLAMRAERYR